MRGHFIISSLKLAFDLELRNITRVSLYSASQEENVNPAKDERAYV